MPTSRHRRLAPVALSLALVFALGACGSDDGADVRDTGSGSGGSASGSGGSGSGGSGSGSASGPADAECLPVGEELEASADETVEIELKNYAFAPNEIEVAAGTVTFVVENTGTEAHELAFLPGGGEVPMTDEGAPDEDALEAAGAFELEAFGTGQTCNATYELEPGTYTMFCIVETPEGTTHLAEGMQGLLTVTAPG